MKTSILFISFLRNLMLILLLFLLSMCNKAKENWQAAKMENSIQAYENIITNFPKSVYSDSSNLMLQKLYFMKLKISDNIPQFLNFLEKFPESTYNDSVRFLLEKLNFIRANDTNTIASYENFIKRYPKSIYADSLKSKLNHLPYFYDFNLTSFNPENCRTAFEISVFHKKNYKPNIEVVFYMDAFYIPALNSEPEFERISENSTKCKYKIDCHTYGMVRTLVPGWKMKLYNNNPEKDTYNEMQLIKTITLPISKIN